MRLNFIICLLFCFLSLDFQTVKAQIAPDARPIVDDRQETPDQKLNPNLPTLYIVGDSTLKSNAPMRGWGQDLAAYFDLKKLNVVNRAIGGRSSRTFQNEGRWNKVLAELKLGDFVVIQFGHNDVGKYDDPAAKERPSLHGEGAETADVTKKDGSTETVHTFGWYLRKYATDAKAKGAKVIFCSMVPHKDWNENRIVRRESATFVKWTENAAVKTGAAYINLNESVALEFERLGREKVETLFADKRTHSTAEGAAFNARIVAAGLGSLKNPKLDRYLSDRKLDTKKMRRFVIDADKR